MASQRSIVMAASGSAPRASSPAAAMRSSGFRRDRRRKRWYVVCSTIQAGSVSQQCRHCPQLVQKGFEPYCCYACSCTPGWHGSSCHHAYPALVCDQCKTETSDGWSGTGDSKMFWWCSPCWRAWRQRRFERIPTCGLVLPAPVFVVGFPKCGTTSLQHALEEVGYGAVHCYTPKRRSELPEDRFVGQLMVKACESGDEPLAYLPSWVNAITQMDCWWMDEDGSLSCHAIFPQISLLEELDRSYPSAKFILNHRDLDKWVQSVKAYGHMQHMLIGADLPGLPKGVGSDERDLILWHMQHIQRVRDYFGSRGRDKYIELCFDDPTDKMNAQLQDFLSLPVELGHHNVTTWAS